MSRLVVALALIVTASAPLSAELKFTMHMELKKSEEAAAPANPMLGIMSDAVLKQLVPEGPADILYLVGEKGARVEYQQAAMGQVAGTVTLARPDGTLIVMNPKEKTYWKTSAQSVVSTMQAAGVPRPEVSAARTGRFETVAGVRCEVITFDWKMAIPVPEAARASLPADFPAAIAMNGDSCVATEQYQQYAALFAKSANAMMATMGFDKIAQGGLVLRQTMRMMGLEMRSAVTQIGEDPASETAFEIPADYKEVPRPVPGK